MPALPVLQDKNKVIGSLCNIFDTVHVETVARQTGFVQRSGTLGGMDFLSLCLSAYETGNGASLEGLCGNLLADGKYMARQSLHERFNGRASAFMQQLSARALSQKLDMPGTTGLPFGRVVITDSTRMELPETFSWKYPGSGGGASTASAKLQYSYDLLAQDPVALLVQDGNHTDNKQLLCDVRENDLRIEDLGYFVLDRFAQVSGAKAFFLSRLKFSTNVYVPGCGKPLSLLDMQRGMREGERKTVDVSLGRDRMLPVRLVVERVPAAVAAEKRRKLKTDKQVRRRNLSRERLALCDINAYITNTTERQLPAAEINKWYSLRWQVEIVFKAWKSVYGIGKVRKTKIERFECMLYAGLLLVLVTTRLLAFSRYWLFRNHKAELSEYKFFLTAKSLLAQLRRALTKCWELMPAFFDVMLELVRRTAVKHRKKTKQTPYQILKIA